jgi:hypothetical protein
MVLVRRLFRDKQRLQLLSPSDLTAHHLFWTEIL